MLHARYTVSSTIDMARSARAPALLGGPEYIPAGGVKWGVMRVSGLETRRI